MIYPRDHEKNVLTLFHMASKRVPAYKNFLEKEHINPSKIKTLDDFKHVPWVDKKNYLTQYPLADLCWDGKLFDNEIISVSSGSTGQPFFWPRGEAQHREGVWFHEQIYKHIFGADNRSTLVIVCFSMGTWIAGTYTTACTVGVARNGKYRINVITPGLEMQEILKAVKALSGQYEQTVIAGYPPFVKDVVDEGYHAGIKWKKLNVRFLFAGEAFSEQWRDYVLARVGSKNPYFDAINIYGTADAAMVAHETPMSIMLRRLYDRRKRAREEVFGTPILPSLVQFYPDKRYFEAVGGELVFSANAGIPLIRYNIHDTGGVLTYAEATEPVKDVLQTELAKNHINEKDWMRPFVYLNGRKDFTVTIYAVNIYPENIKAALVDPRMRSWVTGRFTMATKYRSDMDQYFQVNVELARDIVIEESYKEIAKATIIQKLTLLNGEYRKLHAAIGRRAEPKITFLPYGSYSVKGAKHSWLKKP